MPGTWLSTVQETRMSPWSHEIYMWCGDDRQYKQGYKTMSGSNKGHVEK